MSYHPENKPAITLGAGLQALVEQHDRPNGLPDTRWFDDALVTARSALEAQKLATITVVRRDVYGKQKIYPSCDKAKMIAAIAGTATLTSRVIELARDLGFDVVEEYGRSIWPEV